MNLNKAINNLKRFGIKNTLNRFFSLIGINLNLHDSIRKKRIYLSQKLHELTKGHIIDGVYKGSKFIYSSDYVTIKPAQLLGCYEKEVQQKIFELSKKNNLKYLINIGAGDGYHSIGSKVANLFTNFILFEMDIVNMNVIKKNFELNKCFEGYEVLAKADLNFLKVIEKKIEFNKSLFLIDIEGDEYKILNENNLSNMKESFLILEFHHFYGHLDERERLLDNLNKFFNVSTVTTGNRQFSNFEILNKFNDDEKWLMMSESRSVTMEWLICEPKNLS
jgi:hypothetical protein